MWSFYERKGTGFQQKSISEFSSLRSTLEPESGRGYSCAKVPKYVIMETLFSEANSEAVCRSATNIYFKELYFFFYNCKWAQVDPGNITFRFQDTTQTAWIDAIIKSSYNISLVNALCPINWSLGFFGPRWENWDAYMIRIGSPTPAYQKYVFDTANKTCVLTSDPEYCSKYKYWLEWSNRKGWSFISNKWQMENTNNVNGTLENYLSKCQLKYMNNPTYWGDSQLNIATQK